MCVCVCVLFYSNTWITAHLIKTLTLSNYATVLQLYSNYRSIEVSVWWFEQELQIACAWRYTELGMNGIKPCWTEHWNSLDIFQLQLMTGSPKSKQGAQLWIGRFSVNATNADCSTLETTTRYVFEHFLHHDIFIDINLMLRRRFSSEILLAFFRFRLARNEHVFPVAIRLAQVTLIHCLLSV